MTVHPALKKELGLIEARRDANNQEKDDEDNDE